MTKFETFIQILKIAFGLYFAVMIWKIYDILKEINEVLSL